MGEKLREPINNYILNQTLGEELRGLQGFPGKRGPPGRQGNLGSQGEKGEQGEHGSKK